MKFDGTKLRDEIARRQQSVVDFAQTAGVSSYCVYRAMQGSRVGTKTLGKIAAALKVEKPSDLLEEEDKEMIQDMTLPRERFFKECRATDIRTLSKAMNEEIAQAEAQGYKLTGTYQDLTGRTLSAILKFELVKED